MLTPDKSRVIDDIIKKLPSFWRFAGREVPFPAGYLAAINYLFVAYEISTKWLLIKRLLINKLLSL